MKNFYCLTKNILKWNQFLKKKQTTASAHWRTQLLAQFGTNKFADHYLELVLRGQQF